MKIRNWLLLGACSLFLSLSLNAAEVKMENLPTETTPATGDEVFLTDISASNDLNKITLTNFFAGVPADVVVKGTTPSITIGDAGAEDTALNFDGNAQDFHIALDDSADALEIGFGTTVETDERLTIDGSPTETVITIGDAAAEDMSLNFDGNAQDFHISLDDSSDSLEIGFGTTIETDERITIDGSPTETIITIGDAAAEDMSVNFDGNAQDFHISLDDSADELEIGYGTTIETDERLTIGGGLTATTITIGDAATEDMQIVIDGNAQDFHMGLDDSADDLVFGVGSALGTTQALSINENANVSLDGTTTAVRAFVQKLVTTVIDDTTPDVSQGNIIQSGSNTAANAITDLDGGTAGQIVTIVTTGGANFSTIADSGNFSLSAAWAPDSADDNITLLIQADNDYIEIGRVDN